MSIGTAFTLFILKVKILRQETINAGGTIEMLSLVRTFTCFLYSVENQITRTCLTDACGRIKKSINFTLNTQCAVEEGLLLRTAHTLQPERVKILIGRTGNTCSSSRIVVIWKIALNATSGTLEGMIRRTNALF